MRAPSQLRLRACHAARRFVRRRAVRSRRGAWLPIALRWRRGNAVGAARRDAMRARRGVGGMQVHMHLQRALQRASREPDASTRPVVREFQSTSATSSHTTCVRRDRNATHRVLREDRAFGIGRTSRPVASPRLLPRAPQPTAGTRVIAALRAQVVPMLHPVSRSVEASGAPHDDPRKDVVHPRAQRTAGGAPPSAPPPQSMARLLDMVWRTPAPTPPAATAPPTMSARTSPSASDATAAAGLGRTEPAADAAHVRADVRAQVLDPALVERLADDVIRRIERHARIERERRGL